MTKFHPKINLKELITDKKDPINLVKGGIIKAANRNIFYFKLFIINN